MTDEQRRETLAALDAFGLVEYDAERLLDWIKRGKVPHLTIAKGD